MRIFLFLFGVLEFSGERVSRRSCGSGNPLSSCGRMLAGAGTSVARSSTVSGSLSELTPPYQHQLRRSQRLSEE